MNDFFHPIYVGTSTLSYFTIYNRYGQKVFETNNIQKRWDGMCKGIMQPTGNYIWVIKAKNNQGNLQDLKGSVLLLR